MKPELFHRALVGDAERLPFADRSFDLVFGSPPYCDARTYGIEAQRDVRAWVTWMLRVTDEAMRVSRGPVFWVAAGVTRDRNYQPACEGLMWEWWQRGGTSQLYRPCIWYRSGIPGSGQGDWFRSNTEYVMCFKRPGPLSWADNTACGHKPKYRGGGACSNRMKDGTRVVRRAKSRVGFATRADGSRERQKYIPPEKANPGNFIEFPDDEPPPVVRSIVGGGHLGDSLAHRSEAPFPEDLPERFVLSFCPPGGRVLDPFGGSGTTLAVCRRWHRSCVSLDLRPDQAALARLRVAKVTPVLPSLAYGEVEPRDQDVQHSFLDAV